MTGSPESRKPVEASALTGTSPELPTTRSQEGGEPDERNRDDSEAEPDIRPRIYAASLSDYNNGILHGEWIGAAVEPGDLLDDIADMLDRSPLAARTGQPAEEWAIHDYDDFGPVHLGEYTPVERVTEIANGIAEHGHAFAAWANQIADWDDLQWFDERYLGEWDSIDDYAEEFLRDMGVEEALDTIDPWLRGYLKIDREGLARDLDHSGEIIAVRNTTAGYWIFQGY